MHKHSSSEEPESITLYAKFVDRRRTFSYDENKNIHNHNLQRTQSHKKIVQSSPDIPFIPEKSNNCESPRTFFADSPRAIDVQTDDSFLDYISGNYKIDNKNSIKLKKKIFRHRSLSPSSVDEPKINEFDDDIANSKQVMLWTGKHVKIWLKLIGMDAYSDAFIREEINGQVLLELTENHLKNDIGVSVLGHRLLILKSIESLRIKNSV